MRFLAVEDEARGEGTPELAQVLQSALATLIAGHFERAFAGHSNFEGAVPRRWATRDDGESRARSAERGAGTGDGIMGREEILSRIVRSPRLPTPPAIALQVLNLVNQPTCDLRELAISGRA